MRFVILHHQFSAGHPRQSHWDLMLESKAAEGSENVLTTWALESLPLDRFGIGETVLRIKESEIELEIMGTRLVDHRTHYLTYEGPVSNDRGQVKRIASGTYRVNSETETGMSVELVFAMIKDGPVSDGRCSCLTVQIPGAETGQRSKLLFCGRESRAAS